MYLDRTIYAVVQARMGSSRLPGKVLTDIAGHPALWHVNARVRKSKYVDDLIIATSEDPADRIVLDFAEDNKIKAFAGSEENVLDRFYRAVAEYQPDIVIRLTGDNYLVDGEIIDQGIESFAEQDCDYLHYCDGLPLGMAVELMTFAALGKTYKEATDPACLEHVTPYMYRNPQLFKIGKAQLDGEDLSNIRWTTDVPEDMLLIQEIYSRLYIAGQCFSWREALDLYKSDKDLQKINSNVAQKEVNYDGKKSIHG